MIGFLRAFREMTNPFQLGWESKTCASDKPGYTTYIPRGKTTSDGYAICYSGSYFPTSAHFQAYNRIENNNARFSRSLQRSGADPVTIASDWLGTKLVNSLERLSALSGM